MHRDTKLGLALAILVIGFAAALCFPRQDLKGQTDLPLEMASELDAAIGLTNSKLYLPKEEPEPADVEEVLPLEPVPTPIDAVTSTPVRTEPTPVDPGLFPAERIEPVPAPREVEPEPVVHTRKYKVKVGDTLSGIALQELGTIRHDALLRANQSVLPDANKLMPGMELVIPIPDAPSDLPGKAAPESDKAVEPELPSPAPAPRPSTSTRSAAGRFVTPRSKFQSWSSAQHMERGDSDTAGQRVTLRNASGNILTGRHQVTKSGEIQLIP